MSADLQTTATPEAAVATTSPCPRRLTHVNMNVADWEKSLDFYINVVGLEETYRRVPTDQGFAAGFLSNGNTHHDVAVVTITEVPIEIRRVGLHHVAFELENEDELVRCYGRVAAADAIWFTQDHDNTQSLYSSDPDGNGVEIYTDSVKNWRAVKSGTLVRRIDPWAPDGRPPSTERFYQAEPEIRRVENAVFHPLRATHAVNVISTAGWEATFDYYQDLVGLKVLWGGRDDDYTVFQGTCGERSLSIFRAREGLPAGFHHGGFLVAEMADLEASITAARKQGIELIAEVDHPTRRSVCIRDLDGFRVQLYVDRAPLNSLEGIDIETALYLV